MVEEQIRAIGTGSTDRPSMAGDIVRLPVGRIGDSRQHAAPRVEANKDGRPEMVIELTGAEPGPGRRGPSRAQYQAKYTVDDDTRQVWIQIVDMERNEVVIEFPPEEVRQMAKELQHYLDQARNHTVRRSAVGG